VFTFSDLGHVALFDPVADSWTVVPGTVGVLGYAEGPTVCVAGRAVVRTTAVTNATQPSTWQVTIERLDVQAGRWVPLEAEILLEVPAQTPFGTPDVDCESAGEAFVISLATRTAGPGLFRFDAGAREWQQLPSIPAAYERAALLKVGETVALWPDKVSDDDYSLLEPRSRQWRRVRKPPTSNGRQRVAGRWLLISDSREVFMIDPFAYARDKSSSRG
jgi:hypothetical protein